MYPDGYVRIGQQRTSISSRVTRCFADGAGGRFGFPALNPPDQLGRLGSRERGSRRQARRQLACTLFEHSAAICTESSYTWVIFRALRATRPAPRPCSIRVKRVAVGLALDQASHQHMLRRRVRDAGRLPIGVGGEAEKQEVLGDTVILMRVMFDCRLPAWGAPPGDAHGRSSLGCWETLTGKCSSAAAATAWLSHDFAPLSPQAA
jgi:hypothetical protein